jgi:hypothetical protein
MNSKGLKNSRNIIIDTFMSLFYYFSTNFGLYKSHPLNRNLVLEICKKKDVYP